MIASCVRVGNQNTGASHAADLAHSAGAGATDHQISGGERRRHIVDEPNHLSATALLVMLAVACTHRLLMSRAALMHHLNRQRQLSDGFGYRLIQ